MFVRLFVVSALVTGFVVFTAGTASPATKPPPACKKGQKSTKAHPCRKAKTTAVKTTTTTAKAKPKACPIVGVTGVQGGAPLGDKARGMVSIGCNFEATGLTIQMPGHSFAGVTVNFAGETCSATGDTITCKLNAVGQEQGIAAVGAWQDMIGFQFAAADVAATNSTSGTCGIAVNLTLTNAGAAVFTKSTSTVCQA